MNSQKSSVIVAGDFNARDIDWKMLVPTQECKKKGLCNDLITILGEAGLHQMQRECTRDDAILDLFCINNPSAVKAIDTIPGISEVWPWRYHTGRHAPQSADKQKQTSGESHYGLEPTGKPLKQSRSRSVVTSWRPALLETPTLTGTYLSRTLGGCRPGTSPPNLRVVISTSLGSRVKLRECAGKSVAFIVVTRGPKTLSTRQPLSSYRTRPETPYGKPIGRMLMGYWQMVLRKVISNLSMAIFSPKSRTARVCLLCATMASSTPMHLLRPAYRAISLNLCSPQMSLTLTSDSRAQNSPLYHHWW